MLNQEVIDVALGILVEYDTNETMREKGMELLAQCGSYVEALPSFKKPYIVIAVMSAMKAHGDHTIFMTLGTTLFQNICSNEECRQVFVEAEGVSFLE